MQKLPFFYLFLCLFYIGRIKFPRKNPVRWWIVFLGALLIWSDEDVHSINVCTWAHHLEPLYSVNSNRQVHFVIHVIAKKLSKVVSVNCYFLSNDCKGISFVHTCASRAIWDAVVCLTHLYAPGRYCIGPQDLSPSGSVAGGKHLRWH